MFVCQDRLCLAETGCDCCSMTSTTTGNTCMRRSYDGGRSSRRRIGQPGTGHGAGAGPTRALQQQQCTTAMLSTGATTASRQFHALAWHDEMVPVPGMLQTGQATPARAAEQHTVTRSAVMLACYGHAIKGMAC